MNYDQLKEDLFWKLQPLMNKYNIDEDCPYLKQLIDEVWEDGFSEGYYQGNYE